MSRWKSPQIAAKRAEREAKEADKARKEKLKGTLMMVGCAILAIALLVGDVLFLKARARRRKEEHQKLYHRETNTPPATITNSGSPPATSAEKD